VIILLLQKRWKLSAPSPESSNIVGENCFAGQ
jgi:hypothetical protein